jgi:multidrug efflux pump subunit AcrB
VVSLTLVPMMSARWLRQPQDDNPSRFALRASSATFDNTIHTTTVR